VQRRQSLVADRSFVVELNDESHITDFGAIMPKSERDEVLSVLVRASHTSLAFGIVFWSTWCAVSTRY